jgi:VCBS repeat-containing protein
MRKMLTLGVLTAAFSALALAESWSGRLVDASCADQHKNDQEKTATCDVTGSTTSYALDVSGKIYKFDSNGNTKASQALKSRADRSTDSTQQSSSTSSNATVTGTMQGDTIQVESISVQ